MDTVRTAVSKGGMHTVNPVKCAGGIDIFITVPATGWDPPCRGIVIIRGSELSEFISDINGAVQAFLCGYFITETYTTIKHAEAHMVVISDISGMTKADKEFIVLIGYFLLFAPGLLPLTVMLAFWELSNSKAITKGRRRLKGHAQFRYGNHFFIVEVYAVIRMVMNTITAMITDNHLNSAIRWWNAEFFGAQWKCQESEG